MSMEWPEPIRLSLTDCLVEAAVDFLFLLERGYDRRSALSLVTGRWKLSRLERLALYRCVFSYTTSKRRISKLTYLDDLAMLAIDGFNVLSTVQASLLGDTLLLATDGFVRDLSASMRKIRVSPLLASSLAITLSYLSRYSLEHVVIVLDAQVSRSGELASTARRLMERLSMRGSAVTCRKADTHLLRLSEDYTIATSDSVIIDKASRIVDLGGLLASRIAAEKVINLGGVISSRVAEVARLIAERASEAYEKDGD